MNKEIKEKIADRAGLYWFYVAYLGFCCFFFLTWCIKLPLESNWIDKYHNPIMAGIPINLNLFLLFFVY